MLVRLKTQIHPDGLVHEWQGSIGQGERRRRRDGHDQHGLAQELLDELSPGCSNRFSHADLAGTVQCLGRGQIDVVGACYDKDERANCAEEIEVQHVALRRDGVPEGGRRVQVNIRERLGHEVPFFFARTRQRRQLLLKCTAGGLALGLDVQIESEPLPLNRALRASHLESIWKGKKRIKPEVGVGWRMSRA